MVNHLNPAPTTPPKREWGLHYQAIVILKSRDPFYSLLMRHQEHHRIETLFPFRERGPTHVPDSPRQCGTISFAATLTTSSRTTNPPPFIPFGLWTGAKKLPLYYNLLDQRAPLIFPWWIINCYEFLGSFLFCFLTFPPALWLPGWFIGTHLLHLPNCSHPSLKSTHSIKTY